jgi:hypothetical protein
MARHKSHVHDSIRRVDMATRRHLIDTISLWVSSTEEATPSDQIWLTVFGIARRVPHERQPPDPSGVHRRYAPAHVACANGRMNRSIGSRSDLYSMGVGDGDAPVRGVRSSGTRARPYCATASSPPRTVEGHSGSGVRKRYTMMKWLLATLAGKKPNIDRVGLSTCCWARRGSYTSLISSADVATPLWVIPVAKGSDGIRAVPAK